MSVLQNTVLLRALRREPVPYTPVWLMRQAGRYLPEYNETRRRAGSFLSLCKTPSFATEVTLQPLDRYPLDAAILFSDILTIPDAMGLGLYFVEGEGPRFERPIRDQKAVQSLCVPDMEKLRYVFDAVSMIHNALQGRVPLIGFSGSPWTLACYMVEGGGSDLYHQVKTLAYTHPAWIRHILEINTQTVIEYLHQQVQAGVEVLMLFDTWGGILPTPCYEAWSLSPMRRVLGVLKERHPHIPIIVFTKGGGIWLESIVEAGCDAVGLDWTISLARARALTQGRVALQGNLDPAILLTDPPTIIKAVEEQMADFGYGSGHIFNLGHGLHLSTPPENVKILVSEVHEQSKKYHQVEERMAG